MADRFYCPFSPVDGRATLEGDEARHLTRVRRVGVGESVELFDGRGSAYRAEVVSLGRDRVDLVILGNAPTGPVASCSLILATAVPKGERFDWLVEKTTEMGVTRLIPLVTERSVVDPRSAKIDRLRRVVIEASKQCRRNLLMELSPPTPWSVLVEGSREAFRAIAHPSGRPIASLGLPKRGQQALLAIGPEGGFTAEEVDRAIEKGWQTVGLGPSTLRIETAALVGCATLLALADAEPEKKGVVMNWGLIAAMVGLGIGAGVVGGMFGIGGGLVIVPALVLAFGFDQKTATGTSLLAQLLPVTSLAVYEFWKKGEVDVVKGLGIAAGLVVGAWLGARLAGRLTPSTMKRAYGIFLVVVGFYFLIWTSSTPAPTPPIHPVKNEG